MTSKPLLLNSVRYAGVVLALAAAGAIGYVIRGPRDDRARPVNGSRS